MLRLVVAIVLFATTHQIFLDYNDISEVTSESLVGLTNLRTLSLKHNTITAIVPETLTKKYRWIINAARTHRDQHRIESRFVGSNVVLRVFGARALQFFTNNNHDYEVVQEIMQKQTELGNALDQIQRTQDQIVQLLQQQSPSCEGPTCQSLVQGDAAQAVMDNPAYDVWATMLLALPERSHIMMGNDVWVWAEDDQVARQLLQQSQTWVLQDGLSQPIDLPSLVRICGSTHIAHNGGSLPPC
nr:uncharacterized protein LOC123759252 [Procambarus clarkii]